MKRNPKLKLIYKVSAHNEDVKNVNYVFSNQNNWNLWRYSI